MNTTSASDFNDPARLQQIADDVLARARALGVSAAEVAVNAGEGLSVTVRAGACETVEHERDK